MAPRVFHHLRIGHNGTGQVGKVALCKERKRKLAQLFREGNPSCRRLLVGRLIGRVILPDACDDNECKSTIPPT